MYSLVARQAMTDMAFVGPMAMALALGALALFDDSDAAAAPAGAAQGDAGFWSWPHHPLFYGTLALMALVVIPQLVIDSVQLKVVIPWGGRDVKMYGAVAMIPYYLGFALFVLLAARTRYKAPFYLYLAAIMCGLSVLAKGLAGLGLPVIVFVAYLAFTGNWRRLQAGAAALRHHRVADRVRAGGGALAPRDADPARRRVLERAVRRQPLAAHGDRAPRRSRDVRIFRARARLRPAALDRAGAGGARLGGHARPGGGGAGAADDEAETRKQDIIRLGAIWFVAGYALVSLSMTKFHHYVLPAIPGIAIVVGCFIDELIERGGWRRAAVVGAGRPAAAGAGGDRSRSTARARRSGSCGCSPTTTSTTRPAAPGPTGSTSRAR